MSNKDKVISAMRFFSDRKLIKLKAATRGVL